MAIDSRVTSALEQTATETGKPTYLCVCPFYWGRGETVEAAKREAKRQGGQLRRYVIYETTDPKIYVDDMGYICTVKGAVTTIIQKKGIKE